jgi:hypothetical protein
MSEGRDLSLNREQIIGLLTELGQELDARGSRHRCLSWAARPKAQFIVQEMFPADPAEPPPP